ncbi:DUF1361 domain-containing protein [Flaviaesturariibacter aridisoli]|uniref:DUF1361 domain-containing protein n=1 Tax=Flaviaesturariibacter aridisoli TaxID=2545761 RepID=A0A4V2WMZ4_9BACT|nr:DUF1361 domain-containing protein [Flaviaesturariibacter aridisoli]TCZ73532.1 DUF1361 domain-containing protein [Flaviaesturariibacter aridisoli]
MRFFNRIVAAVRRLDAAERVLLASIAFPAGLSAWRFAYSGSRFFLFLNWNLLLALIPFLLTRQLLRRVDWIESRWGFRFLFGLWLLFLPNTFYISTDLLHLRQRPGLPLWYDLVLLLAFAWNGLLLGVQSLWQMERVLLARWGLRRSWLFVFPVLALCSFGVYIGRYLRYNSWDLLLAPGGLARDLFDLFRHPFANRFDWSMIVCFFGFLVLVYESMRRTAAEKGPGGN